MYIGRLRSDQNVSKNVLFSKLFLVEFRKNGDIIKDRTPPPIAAGYETRLFTKWRAGFEFQLTSLDSLNA